MYFPEDSAPRKNTPVEDIREVMYTSASGFWVKDLNTFLGRQFHHEEKGEDFKIVSIELDSNKFECAPVSGPEPNHQYFGIGEILRAIKSQMEKQREAWTGVVVCTKFYLGTSKF